MSQTSFPLCLFASELNPHHEDGCEYDSVTSHMMRWFIWVFVALTAHAGLLFLPVSDSQIAGAGRSELTVKISGYTSESKQQDNLQNAEGSVSKVASEILSEKRTLDENPGLEPVPVKAANNKQELVQPVPLLAARKLPAIQEKILIEPIQRTLPEPTVAKVVQKPKLQPTKLPLQNKPDPNSGPASSNKLMEQPQRTNTQQVTAHTSLVFAQPLSDEKPKYPRRAVVRNQQGEVKVELLINQHGEVEKATLLNSSGFKLLDKSVMKFVKQQRFLPRLRQGGAVASTQLFIYRFVLEG